MAFDRSVILKIAPDEVPYPEETSQSTPPMRRPTPTVTGSLVEKTAYDPIIESASDRHGVPARLLKARHSGGIGVSAARAIAQGRDGADAADAGHRAAISDAQPVRPARATSRRAPGTSRSCSRSSSCRSRWPPTTPAKPRCADLAAFRRTPRPRPTSPGFLVCCGSRVYKARPQSRAVACGGLVLTVIISTT